MRIFFRVELNPHSLFLTFRYLQFLFLVDATEGGAVDTEMRRFLKVLSEPATFHINNNNSTRRQARKRERKRGGAGKKRKESRL